MALFDFTNDHCTVNFRLFGLDAWSINWIFTWINNLQFLGWIENWIATFLTIITRTPA